VAARRQRFGEVTADEARTSGDRYLHGGGWTLTVGQRRDGLPAICIDPSSCRLLPLAAHDDLLRAHGRQEVADRDGEALLDKRVVDAVGLATLSDETRALEDAQVSRDGRAADRESSGYFPGRKLASPQIREDLAASRVGECPEDAGLVICHYRYLATELDMTQVLAHSRACRVHRLDPPPPEAGASWTVE
jgi:hypothetical protein